MSQPEPPGRAPRAHWRERLHEVIFEADTPAGRAFDLALIWAILLSIAVIMLDSVPEIGAQWRPWLDAAEWGFTGLFTVEYALRLLSVRRPLAYARSFFGVVDLAAVLPTYLALLFPGGQYFLAVRVLRLIRVFRVLKLANYLDAAGVLMRALRASRPKITVFLVAVIALVVMAGALLYVVEGAAAGFTSIPVSVYWAIVTVTTVGYGDIAPVTPLGQFLAALLMITGYGVIAVPTGVVTAELTRASRPVSTQACPACAAQGHDVDAKHCKFCGERL